MTQRGWKKMTVQFGGRGRELQRHRPCRARPIVSRSSLLFLLLISADMCYDDVSNQETRDAPAAAAGRRGTDQPERGKWTFTTTINLRRWSRYRRKIRDLFVQMHKREWLPVYTSRRFIFLAYWYQQRQRIISHAIRVFFGAHSGTMTGAYPGIKAAMLRITHY